jgi:NAD(P)-dependent dehydrogenase (short-subunit alcohol dehydrogenase family)
MTGLVCVVTGATGMAGAGARALAASGASVFIIARKPGTCAELVDEIAASGGTASWAQADLTNEGQTEAAFEKCVGEYGRIDGLFAVAGGSARRFGDGPTEATSLDGFRAAMEVNAVPAFLAAREGVRAMLKQDPRPNGCRGSILLMSSVLASSPAQLFATHGYASSKGAINALARTMAGRYAPSGIRVNAVAPGLVATPMSERAQNDPESVAYAERKQPLAAGLIPAEAAGDLAVFFLSDASRYVTGEVITLDGGWSVTEAPT